MAQGCMYTKQGGKKNLTSIRYNGTSDLQLERMNVYFNEVRLLLSTL